MEWISEHLEELFPNLTRANYHKTSEKDEFHNCIAYAAGDETQWWEPPLQPGIIEPGRYWPPGVPIEPSLENLVKAYEKHGFSECSNDLAEVGYQKVALYEASDGYYAHAAKLMENGKWRSKLGDAEDIEHDTCAVLEEGPNKPAYGKSKKYMKRPIQDA